MSFDIPSFKTTLKTAFDQIKADQSEVLSIQIAANFTAGMTAAEKHQSIKSADAGALEEDGLTKDEKAAIALLLAQSLGSLTKFNDVAQDQILSMVKDMVAAGNTMDEIKQYVDDVFSEKETILIDNIGKKRKELYVDKDLTISEVTKTVSKTFSASLFAYAAMLAATVVHGAYEAGRKAQYQRQGNSQWVFAGPADERARPWHVSLLGQVYEWGTEQSEYAEKCLKEPRCRHRARVFYNDERDVPASRWQKLKEENGLYFDEKEDKWSFK